MPERQAAEKVLSLCMNILPNLPTCHAQPLAIQIMESCFMSETHSVTITRQDKFKFLIDFEPGLGQIMGDEAPPIGDGTGPTPAHLLAAAMANCLSASLVFAIGKFKGDPGHLVTTATWEVGRNEQNRLRVTGVNVAITLGVAADTLPRLDRALEQFEDFCTVSQSVRAGIPFNVTVKEVDGTVLKQG